MKRIAKKKPENKKVVGGTTWLTGLLPGLSEGLAGAQSSARAGLHTITQRLGEYWLDVASKFKFEAL